ncbi:hypothetical protein LTS18_012367, partial [Coniosporium uncinatum]
MDQPPSVPPPLLPKSTTNLKRTRSDRLVDDKYRQYNQSRPQQSLQVNLPSHPVVPIPEDAAVHLDALRRYGYQNVRTWLDVSWQR